MDLSTWQTGELPDRDNKSGVSCIPPGTYLARWLLSPKHGWCYHLQGVPGRSEVEIHSANWMGDESKGYRCELRGCVALGVAIGTLGGQKAILESRHAVAAFHDKMDREDLELTIIGIPVEIAIDHGELTGLDG